jgi:nitrogenase molybdenum-iron protein NifN
MEGFHGAVASVAEQMVEGGPVIEKVNLLPGFVSSADFRYLREVMDDFGLNTTMLPDLSETMDGPALLEYEKIQAGGTPLAAVKAMGCSRATIEFGRTLKGTRTGGLILKGKHDVDNFQLGMPIGIEETDRFVALLERLSGRKMPEKYAKARGRLVDAYVDGHKYVFGKKAIVYGEEDLVVAMTAFLAEIGVRPILCASGGTSGQLAEAIHEVTGGILPEQPVVHEGMDFFDISDQAESLAPDLIVGHSKGYPLARKLSIPLVRVGFPIHDRVGGQRILHLGYHGAQQLFDTIVNAIIDKKQNDSEVGYSYM